MTDWAAWSEEAKRSMSKRNQQWMEEYGLTMGAPWRYTLDPPELIIQRDQDEVVAQMSVAGTCSGHEGTFLWAWANEALPNGAYLGLSRARAFGQEHELGMLTSPEWPAGHAEALEATIIAGRIMDAKGVFAANAGDVTLFLVLRDFALRP